MRRVGSDAKVSGARETPRRADYSRPTASTWTVHAGIRSRKSDAATGQQVCGVHFVGRWFAQHFQQQCRGVVRFRINLHMMDLLTHLLACAPYDTRRQHLKFCSHLRAIPRPRLPFGWLAMHPRRVDEPDARVERVDLGHLCCSQTPAEDVSVLEHPLQPVAQARHRQRKPIVRSCRCGNSGISAGE